MSINLFSVKNVDKFILLATQLTKKLRQVEVWPLPLDRSPRKEMRRTQFVAALIEITSHLRPSLWAESVPPIAGKRHNQRHLPGTLGLALCKGTAAQRSLSANAGRNVISSSRLIAISIMIAEQHSANAVALQIIVATILRTRRQKHLHA